MTLERAAVPDDPGPRAERLESSVDAAGLIQVRERTCGFVARHLPAATARAERLSIEVCALVRTVAGQNDRLIVEMDATAHDIQLIVRLQGSDGLSAPFGLVQEAGGLELWLRVTPDEK